MSQTISQIVDQVATELGKKPTGQPVSGAVSADLTQAYNEVWATLSREGLVSWGSTDSIPNEYVYPVVMLVASRRTRGISNEKYQRIKIESNKAREMIKDILDGIWTNPEEVTDY